jgi:hypothetical protein
MKILTLDIETSPHEAYAFQVWQANRSGTDHQPNLHALVRSEVAR